MYKHFFKRLIDVFVSLIALPFVFLAIIIFGPIIFLSDKGPIFYCGKRIGKNGKIFKMVKFRSMRVNAPDIRLKDGSTFNAENDPRVTKIGKFLRKTSIDELPQFLNVFIGQMSLIGPRPDTEKFLAHYDEHEDDRSVLSVKPGITGLNQVINRNNSNAREKLLSDKEYVSRISFRLDTWIFFKTISMVLRKKNVYREGEEEKNEN